MTGTYSVSVVLSFPVSSAQAAKVLERWWAFKEKRKRYMRVRRGGRMKKAVPRIDVVHIKGGGS